MPKQIISIQEMYKTYKMGDVEVCALNNINLDIEEEDFTAIVGPSGSGKSTLMNMIGCLDVPTSGKYYIDGQEVSTMNDNELADMRNQKIGFIFQSFNLLSKLNAFENVELPLIYRGLPVHKRKEMATEALERVGLGDRMHHKPKELSGGQQQRVAIARALAGKPSIILADEPTGALDSKSGIEVMGMLHELHKEGHTIILITHDNNIANQAARKVQIQDGQITFDSREGGINA